MGSTCAEYVRWIGPREVCPLNRNGPDNACVIETEHSMTREVTALPHEKQLLPCERVERVSDPHKRCCCDRNRGILRLVISDSPAVGSPPSSHPNTAPSPSREATFSASSKA